LEKHQEQEIRKKKPFYFRYSERKELQNVSKMTKKEEHTRE